MISMLLHRHLDTQRQSSGSSIQILLEFIFMPSLILSLSAKDKTLSDVSALSSKITNGKARSANGNLSGANSHFIFLQISVVVTSECVRK